MSQPLSIEDKTKTYFITTRTAGSKLWFAGKMNKDLENGILACLARYQQIHGVKILGFIIMGNHYHLIAQFPNANRAQFMRDFNSAIARLVGRYFEQHGRRSVWARRYSWQILPRNKDILHWFLYLVANPTSSGLIEDPLRYPGYNSFLKAPKDYYWIDYSKYCLAKRSKPDISLDEFKTKYTLTYSKLPGFEKQAKGVYEASLKGKLTLHTDDIIAKRRSEGKSFMGIHKLLKQSPGQSPKTTKQGKRYSFRPIVLTLCKDTRKKILDAYFSIRDSFLAASQLLRQGVHSAVFPSGTCKPSVFVT